MASIWTAVKPWAQHTTAKDTFCSSSPKQAAAPTQPIRMQVTEHRSKLKTTRKMDQTQRRTGAFQRGSAAPSSGHIGCTAKTSQTAQPEWSSGRGEVTAAKHNRLHVMIFSALTRETRETAAPVDWSPITAAGTSSILTHSIRRGRIHTKDPETKWWINSCPLWKWRTTSAQSK